MARDVEGFDRRQSFLLPESLQDYVGEDNPVRVIDVFVDRIDLVRAWVWRGPCRQLPVIHAHIRFHPTSVDSGGFPRFWQLLR